MKHDIQVLTTIRIVVDACLRIGDGCNEIVILGLDAVEYNLGKRMRNKVNTHSGRYEDAE